MTLEIPKTIHYIWFGGKPLPPLARRCIESWHRHMPGHEIIRWDETNFDVNAVPYTAAAYSAGKYAFVSDYARFRILYDHGGVYLDTDVELIKPLDDILSHGAFMGCEDPIHKKHPHGRFGVNAGLGMAAPPAHPFYRQVLDFYETATFKQSENGFATVTVVDTITAMMKAGGLTRSDNIQNILGINIYPPEYFSPMDFDSGKIRITPHTRSIHHYAASWFSAERKIHMKITRLLGPDAARQAGKVWKFIRSTIFNRQ